MSLKPDLGPEFLSRLARGGFAETLSESQRLAIHIETKLDEFLSSALEQGKQIVLTGNPGDGKTQYILIQKEDRSAPDDAFWLPDASAATDYKDDVLDPWQEALEADQPGILAINEGPLHEILTEFGGEYSFLTKVSYQLNHQTILENDHDIELPSEDIVVVNLEYRNVLSRPIARQAINKLTQSVFVDSASSDGHIEYNISKLRNDRVQENIKRLFGSLGKLDVHVTIRDLLNFIAYIITGGKTQTVVDYDDDLIYYNLAYTGRGGLFDLLRTYRDPEVLTHPFVDSALWAEAQQNVNPRDIEDARTEIRQEYVRKKRRFIFEDEAMDLGYSSKDLYHVVDYGFLNHRNADTASSEDLENLLRRLNGYFSDSEGMTYELQLWSAHRYIGGSTQAIVSRHSVSKSDFDIKRPKLNPVITDAIEYVPSFFVLEYTAGDVPVRLKIGREMYSSFQRIESGIPYILRDREEEQVILEFMRDIEYEETKSETSGTVTIKDTNTGKTERFRIRDNHYEVD